MSIRIGASVAVIVAAAGVGAPAAQAAKSKLYSVSLSGDVRSEITEVSQSTLPPEGFCEGTTTQTRRFVASAGLVPKPSRFAPLSHGRLRLRAQLTSPTAESTFERVSNFTPSPVFPPPDPSLCAPPRESQSFPCTFAPGPTSGSGGEFVLLPLEGRYELYYNRHEQIVSCEDTGESLLDTSAPLQTNLRERAVKRLAKGQSASASGTATAKPLNPNATAGGQTLTYTLKVKRVR